jgi:hypothetical protein
MHFARRAGQVSIPFRRKSSRLLLVERVVYVIAGDRWRIWWDVKDRETCQSPVESKSATRKVAERLPDIGSLSRCDSLRGFEKVVIDFERRTH